VDLRDADIQQFAEADRGEIDPRIAGEAATWSAGGTLDWWVIARRGGVAYAAPTVVKSELLIFVVRAVHSHSLFVAFVPGRHASTLVSETAPRIGPNASKSAARTRTSRPLPYQGCDLLTTTERRGRRGEDYPVRVQRDQPDLFRPDPVGQQAQLHPVHDLAASDNAARRRCPKHD
jgi:hypothetical protein